MSRRNLPRHRQNKKQQKTPTTTPAADDSHAEGLAASEEAEETSAQEPLECAESSEADRTEEDEDKDDNWLERQDAVCRMRMRYLLWSGSFTPRILQQMLYSQILTDDEVYTACHDCHPDDGRCGGRHLRVPRRPYSSECAPPRPGRSGVPPFKVACWFDEEHRDPSEYHKPDLTIPCAYILEGRRWADPEEITQLLARVPARLRPILSAEIQPCNTLVEFLSAEMEMVLGLPEMGGWHNPRQLTQEAQELRSLVPEIGHRTPLADLQRLLRFLVASRRLAPFEPYALVRAGVTVQNPDWLPCQDDPARNQTVPQMGRESPPYHVPRSRERCRLHDLAVLGDRDFPCVEVMDLKPRERLLKHVRRFYEEGMHSSSPPPRSWSSPKEKPGGPRDIVRQLNVRPCYLLGLILRASLPKVLRRLAQDQAWLEQDLRTLGKDGTDEADQMPAETPWSTPARDRLDTWTEPAAADPV